MKMLKTTFVVALVTLAFAAMTVQAGGKPFHTGLVGSEEFPGPGDPDGSGSAHLTLNQGTGQVCYEIVVTDILLPATGAHIHEAPAGASGGVVVALGVPDESGVSAGCVTADKELVKEIRENPQEYYVNVHTQEYPAGALRGQL